jgi:hypothetical protein
MHELLPIEVLVLQVYLSIKDISCLDIAICDVNLRWLFLDSLQCVKVRDECQSGRGEFFLAWVIKRHIKLLNFIGCAITFIIVKDMEFDAIEELEFHDKGNYLKGYNILLDLSNIIECGPVLKKLDLSRLHAVEDVAIRIIVENCPILQVLHLPNRNILYEITDATLLKLAESCPMLQELHISNCRNITDITIIRIAECCSMIRVLDLSGCHKIADTAVTRIADCCSVLQELDLSFCSRVTATAIVRIVERCSKLRRLTVKIPKTGRPGWTLYRNIVIATTIMKEINPMLIIDGPPPPRFNPITLKG